ncbi:uncharacterized protein SCHCODRAFT_02620698 [Schizophyllum commune H4-8]|uniref:uncharacterized protein n=1 Tax=Schizophyllum commune (strain H4-8 / FGSC 9210) TaxID=578458 RepID=UPI00215FAF4F|nr:uncharacterized protein SCHCODRAFT_02620698 [Schizophyllum commune H4-8]KAI5893040.1 hypothetical protein SCHCODRAFT_02620698 [Schizophyllum commune H4-8]
MVIYSRSPRAISGAKRQEAAFIPLHTSCERIWSLGGPEVKNATVGGFAVASDPRRRSRGASRARSMYRDVGEGVAVVMILCAVMCRPVISRAGGRDRQLSQDAVAGDYKTLSPVI